MKEPTRRLIANHYLIKITMIDGLIAFRAFAMSEHTVSPVENVRRKATSRFPVPLRVGMGLDANLRITPPTLLALELEITQERVAADARASREERPWQVAYPPTPRARRPKM
jgi:hypothetical protein